MSLAAVRRALETELADVLGDGFDVAWENANFTPTTGEPYAQATLLPASPENPEIGQTFIERGIFQANLFYPIGDGSAAATAKAEAIRSAFSFGRALTNGGVTVTIIATPEIAVARPDDDRFLLPVRVRWRAFVEN